MDSLVRLNKAIEWERFRPTLHTVLKKESKGAGGRPPYDCVLMFKILILQRIYNLIDNQIEYQINNRIAKHNIHVPIDNMQIAEDLHMILDHMMMWVLGQDEIRKKEDNLPTPMNCERTL